MTVAEADTEAVVDMAAAAVATGVAAAAVAATGMIVAVRFRVWHAVWPLRGHCSSSLAHMP